MRYLNYNEIRTLVRSKQIYIDINPTIFYHPYYNQANISDLDFQVKDRAFHNHFLKISDSSYNPAYFDILNNQYGIKVHAVLRPRAPFLDIKGKTFPYLFFVNFMNFVYQVDSIAIKPGSSVTIPLTLRILEGLKIPEIRVKLNENLIEKGLVCVNVIHSQSSTTNTHLVIANTSTKTIRIKDLEELGQLYFVQS